MERSVRLYTTRRIRDSVCTQTRVEKLVALRLPPVAKAASTSTSSPVSEQQVVLTHPTSDPSPKIKAGHSRATRGGEFLSEGGTSSMPNRAASSPQTNIAAMFQPRQARSNPSAGAHPAQRAPTPPPPRSARQTGSFRQVTARSSRAAQLPASAPARRTAPPPPSTGAAPPPRVTQATEPTVSPPPQPATLPGPEQRRPPGKPPAKPPARSTRRRRQPPRQRGQPAATTTLWLHRRLDTTSSQRRVTPPCARLPIVGAPTG